jgi:hypothetical protein
VYEAKSLPLIRVRSRVTDATWEKRVAQATRDEVVIKRILAAEAKGRSLNEAIAQERCRSGSPSDCAARALVLVDIAGIAIDYFARLAVVATRSRT